MIYICQLCGVGCFSSEDLLRHVSLVGFHEGLIVKVIQNMDTDEDRQHESMEGGRVNGSGQG